MSDDTPDRALTHLVQQAERAIAPTDDGTDEAGYNETALLETDGPVAGYVRANPDGFSRLDRWLRQGRFGVPVDEYAQRSVRLAGWGALAGLFLGVALAVTMAVGGSLGLGGVVAAAVGLPLFGVALAAATVLGARFGYPALVVHQRQRRIDLGLPHATVFLYSLSHGGMDLYEVLEQVAEAEPVYGEVSREFRQVVREIEQFDQDLFGALSTTKELTPSDDLRTFLDELVSVLETGGDVDAFLHDEAQRHRELAEQHQERLVEELGTVAEIYVAAVFAGPIFLLVVLLVASFVVEGLLFPMQLLVYVGLPLAVIWFAVAIDYLLEPYRQHTGESEESTLAQLRQQALATARSLRGGAESDAEGETVDRQKARYRRARRRSVAERARDAPLETMRRLPLTSLLVTVPLGALTVLVYLLADAPGAGLFASGPLRTTTALFTVPFLLAAGPFAYFYRQRRERSRTLRGALPVALEVIADADANEVPLGESFSLVAQRMSGPLRTELDRIDRDIRWTDDVTGALGRFADRTAVPTVDRVIHLLQESVRATSDLAPVLDVVADDLSARNDVRERQRRNMRPYVLVVFVGVFVYLGIVVLFDSHFLPVATDVARTSAGSLTGTPLTVGDVPVETYHRIFVHSALIQAIGNGLLLGVLIDNRVRSGVGYAAVLVGVQLAVFVLFL